MPKAKKKIVAPAKPTNVNMPTDLPVKQAIYFALVADLDDCLSISVRATPEEILMCAVVGKNNRLVRIPESVMLKGYKVADPIIEWVKLCDKKKTSVPLKGV